MSGLAIVVVAACVLLVFGGVIAMIFDERKL